MFVSKDLVAVTVDGENVIDLLPKMSYAVKQRVIGAATKMKMGHAEDTEINIGEWQIALLVMNVRSWRGNAFAGVECTPANIERLDPDEPLVTAVLDKIAELNPVKESPVPNSPGGNTSTTAGAPPSPAA
jgi:hypothetical protein